ncbi:MAG: sigma-70 family RNA polymerase sigma factor [Burkholderiaceae bacterium]
MQSDSFNYEATLEACKQGDRLALKSLYDREVRWLLGVALRIVRDRQLAEDIVQDSFIQIWSRADSFDSTQGSARGWIYTVVRHRAISEVRRPSFSRSVRLDEVEPSIHEQTVAGASIAAADSQLLQHCLDGLDEERRVCIEAAFLEGYTQSELAARFDKPLGTIKSWIRRGLLTLRECLR